MKLLIPMISAQVLLLSIIIVVVYYSNNFEHDCTHSFGAMISVVGIPLSLSVR